MFEGLVPLWTVVFIHKKERFIFYIMHNHKRYLGGAVSSVIFFFGAMDNPSISHLNCWGVISLSSSSERGH
jgi:hypothetical protein